MIFRYSEDDNDKKSKYSVCVQRQNHEKFGHMTVAYLGPFIPFWATFSIYIKLKPMKFVRFQERHLVYIKLISVTKPLKRSVKKILELTNANLKIHLASFTTAFFCGVSLLALLEHFKGRLKPFYFWNQCRKEADPTYNDSEIEWRFSRLTQNRLKIQIWSRSMSDPPLSDID